MPTRMFDLNIEEVLENWDVEHALREVIANALDEQLLTGTAPIQIGRDSSGAWHVWDWGRGLRIEHFTLNENAEKLHAPNGVIGKFGVGLKDALATFHRHGISVAIVSPAGTFRLQQARKHGFSDIVTLHVEYDDRPTGIRGTDFVLHGVTEHDMAAAKSLFLKFAGDEVLETTRYGQILRRTGGASRVYIQGVFASDEPNFLFSYNITSLTDAMRKKLNRERVNVGRTTYAERVKAILKSATNPTVHNLIVDQLRKRSMGQQCDEMGWIEISQMALNLMHQCAEVVYFTEQELQSDPDILGHARSDGYEVVVVTEQQKEKLAAQALGGGLQVRTVEQYIQEFNDSFHYQFVSLEQLTASEQHIFNYTQQLLDLIGITRSRHPAVYISETMRLTCDDTQGVWDPQIPAIIIKRPQLRSLADYAATLLHEVAHATTGTADVTRAFESVLTSYLGRIAAAAINRA